MRKFRFLICFIICCSIASLFMLNAFASELPTEEVIETSAPETTHEESEEIIRSVSPITPSEASGFKSVLLSLFGNYDTIVTEHRYTNSNGYTSVSIDIEEDWVWIISAAIFSLFLYCIFRLIGGVFFGRK